MLLLRIPTLVTFVFVANVNLAQILTIGEIFDFEIGDEFHSKSLDDVPPNAIRKTIIDKQFSNDNTSVTYTIALDNYSSVLVFNPGPSLQYSFFADTVDVTYDYLDSLVTDEIQGFMYDTTIFVSDDLCGHLVNSYSYCIGDFEPECWERAYAQGLGVTLDKYYWTGAGGQIGNSLFYYRKGNITCGVPDDTHVGITRILDFPSLNVFPNPAEEQALIRFPHPITGSLSLINSGGLLVREIPVSGSEFMLDREALPSGIYLLRLQAGQDLPLVHMRLVFN